MHSHHITATRRCLGQTSIAEPSPVAMDVSHAVQMAGRPVKPRDCRCYQCKENERMSVPGQDEVGSRNRSNWLILPKTVRADPAEEGSCGESFQSRRLGDLVHCTTVTTHIVPAFTSAIVLRYTVELFNRADDRTN